MESATFHSFSAHVPFKQPVVITHYISMVIAFLGFYPLLLTRQLRRQKIYILAGSLIFSLIGFISGSFISVQNTTSSVVLHLFAFLLFFLVTTQAVLVLCRIEKYSTRWINKIPKWVDLALGWFSLVVAFSYLTLAALVFTESCNNNEQPSQCLMPVAMGTGFVLYGTVSMLHLLAIVKLPRPSTPEYYEGVILTFWGFISLLLAGTPIIGSEWRAINLGLLWFTGGLFSISLSVQTWIPALRERNIINSLILFLTGRAIVTGLTQDNNTYAAEVHTMLGYILMIGAMSRLTLIVFRKSPVDNLPHHMFLQTADTTLEVDEEDDTFVKDNLEQQLKCKHTFIFATVTLVAGLISSLLAICGGILFMGANVGWMEYMQYYIQDPSTYVNITLAVAFLWSAYIFGLCTMYKNLKASNALYQYEYLELANHEPMVDLPRHLEREERQDYTIPTPLPLSIHTSAMMREDSPPLQQQPFAISPINLDHETPIVSPTSTPLETFTTITLEKTIRPSEYRAKRRSLLIQAPVTTTRARSSSSFGVGGVLPDEIIQLQKVPTPPADTTFRRSWLSSGSSVGYYSGSIDSSSAPNSPNSDGQRPYSSISATLPQAPHTHHARRNSSSEPIYDRLFDENEESGRSVHKTESGKRKERRLMNQYYHSSENVVSNSSGSKFQRWSLKNEAAGQSKK